MCFYFTSHSTLLIFISLPPHFHFTPQEDHRDAVPLIMGLRKHSCEQQCKHEVL